MRSWKIVTQGEEGQRDVHEINVGYPRTEPNALVFYSEEIIAVFPYSTLIYCVEQTESE